MTRFLPGAYQAPPGPIEFSPCLEPYIDTDNSRWHGDGTEKPGGRWAAPGNGLHLPQAGEDAWILQPCPVPRTAKKPPPSPADCAPPAAPSSRHIPAGRSDKTYSPRRAPA